MSVVCSMRNTLRGRKTEIRLFDSAPWGTPRRPPLLFPEDEAQEGGWQAIGTSSPQGPARASRTCQGDGAAVPGPA